MDTESKFEDSAFPGIEDSSSKSGYYTIRTMEAQLGSTRLFNENYYAFLATLDQLANDDIKLVLFTGDLTDDGQVMNLELIDKTLSYYQETFQMQFFTLPGNHDPVNPYTTGSQWSDFLGEQGQNIEMNSQNSAQCLDGSTLNCTVLLDELGYEQMTDYLGDYGYMPQSNYIYWDTPYTTYDYDTYNYEESVSQANVEDRTYEMCTQGTGGIYKQDDYTNCEQLFDMTYVVEPTEDLWILMVDGNVYTPLGNNEYESTSSAGYNKMLTHKKYTLDFIEEIIKSAEENGKTLITATHYPAVDFYDGQSELIVDTFGEDGLEMKRNPKTETSSQIADLGVGLHLSGHLHYNDTGVYQDDENYLVNIATPSIAGYVPAYKVITILDDNEFQIETNIVEDVENFEKLFAFYQTEYDYLSSTNQEWNKEILEVENYREFTNMHLDSLAKGRHLEEWPIALQDAFRTLNLYDLLLLSFESQDRDSQDLELILKQYGYDKSSLEMISGLDVVGDFFRLLNAGELSFEDIDSTKISAYSLVNTILLNVTPNTELQLQIKSIFEMMYYFSNDVASDDFIVNLDDRSITDLNPKVDGMQILEIVDFDADGILDSVDLCTNSALNEIVDEHGCRVKQEDPEVENPSVEAEIELEYEAQLQETGIEIPITLSVFLVLSYISKRKLA